MHRVAAGGRLRQVRGQCALGERGRPRCQLLPVSAGAQGVEQLPRRAPRRMLLERAAACAQHDRPVLARAARGGGQERRLADPGRALDDDHAPFPAADARHPLGKRGELGVTVEQHGHR